MTSRMIDLTVAAVTALCAAVLTYPASSDTAPEPQIKHEFIDPDGECFGLRNCDDWECNEAYVPCYPCSDDTETVEFCGGDGETGCKGTLYAAICGKQSPGVCSYALVCITLGPTDEDCDGNKCQST